MKKITVMLLAFALIVTGTACMAGEVTAAAGTTTIKLNGNSISLEGSGATVNGNTVTITSAGTYNVGGTLNNGQIKVDTQDAETVKLVLNGMDISCSTSAPIYVVNAEKTVITLTAGTKNTVTDGSSYTGQDSTSGEPDAAIFSKDDLTINGDGSLTVNANYNDGITSKDDLKINGGSIAVNAVNDGIRGRDSVVIKGGTTTIKAESDGIQSTNDDDSTKGYVSIKDGTVKIISGADGIQAETSLTVSGGSITIASGGGAGKSINPTTNTNSRGIPGDTRVDTSALSGGKGLKAGTALTITGGIITIDSSDDSIHSHGGVTINGGAINAATGDDGIHAESNVEINGGDIRITNSYEGIEGADITINDGTIRIVASDDALNTPSGTGVTSTSTQPVNGQNGAGQPGQGTFETSGDMPLHINGGYLVVNAGGDGLDINGAITMTGGVVIVNGPTDDGNGAIDYAGSFKLSGGTLVAAGSSGMAQAPDTSSTQYSVMMTYASVQPAGTMVHVETRAGEDILTFVPAKTYQSVVFSLPELTSGTVYIVYSGGSSTGTVKEGLYTGGTYTPGTQVTNFTISTIVTNAGSAGAKIPGAMPGNRMNGITGNKTGDLPNDLNSNMFGGLTGKTTNSILSNYTSGKTSWTTTGLLSNITRSRTSWTTDRIVNNSAIGKTTSAKSSFSWVAAGTLGIQSFTTSNRMRNEIVNGNAGNQGRVPAPPIMGIPQ
ncbi:MAG: carbohydrate-binding domain-containing protein [Methanomicrobiales archaeon]